MYLLMKLAAAFPVLMSVFSKLLALCVAPQSFSQDPLNVLQELVDILWKGEVRKRNHSGNSVECKLR